MYTERMFDYECLQYQIEEIREKIADITKQTKKLKEEKEIIIKESEEHRRKILIIREENDNLEKEIRDMILSELLFGTQQNDNKSDKQMQCQQEPEARTSYELWMDFCNFIQNLNCQNPETESSSGDLSSSSTDSSSEDSV